MAVILLVGVFISSYFILSALYNLFLHPLRSVPGPFFCKISTLPSFYHACIGDRHVWLWQLFQVYGSRIRVSPNIVLFNTPTANNAIFSYRPSVKKSEFYAAWPRKANEVNTLCVTDVKEHARRRKMLGQAFTETSTKAAGKIAERHIERWDELLLAGSNQGENEGWTPPRNMAEWTGNLFFDIMGDMAFGKQFDVKETGFESQFKNMPVLVESYMKFMYPILKSPLLHPFVWLKPRGLNRLFDAISPPNVTKYWEFVDTAVAERVKLEKTLESTAEKPTSPNRDWFSFLLAIRDESGTQGLSLEDLTAEASLLVIAGHDTSATATCATFFYLAHNPRVQAKLAKEIRSTFASPEDIVYGPKLSSCTYLRACIDESLRLAHPAPSELERIVTGSGLTVDGNFYPPGTALGTPNFALYRNETVFGDAYTYRPERWIVSHDLDTLNTAEDVKRIKDSFFSV